MPDDTTIGDLLILWEEGRQQGRTLTAEELCRDCPELLEEARRQIRALEAIYRVPNRPVMDEATCPFDDDDPRAGHDGKLPDRVADYEILGLLGRGGMGVVYEARQVTLGRPVALKMIVAGAHAGPDERARFRLEAEAVARLQHPNVVTIYEVGEQEGRPYLAMEHLQGGSLERRLDGKPHAADDAARLIETLARAVDHAHRRGIVHRDLKPANVLLAADGTPKVGDFGLAKRLTDDGRGDFRTRTGAVLGTPSYMAPEQATGDGQAVGPATDVYSLGTILYELLTGRSPFRGTNPLETLEQVRTLDPVPPRRLRPTLPRELEVICLKCLEKEPARRYAAAGDLADDLARYQKGEPIQARDSSVLERVTDALRRGQHDKELHVWGNFCLATIPIAVTPHLIVQATALLAPDYVRAAFILPWCVFLAICGSLFWANRTRFRLPVTPAVRQVLAMLIAHMIASSALSPVCRIVGLTANPRDELRLYPFLSLLIGQLYFGLGGMYWGGCYLAGLGYIVAAPIMAAVPTWAPLLLAAVLAPGHLAIGMHLRGIGRERSGSAGGGPGSSA